MCYLFLESVTGVDSARKVSLTIGYRRFVFGPEILKLKCCVHDAWVQTNNGNLSGILSTQASTSGITSCNFSGGEHRVINFPMFLLFFSVFSSVHLLEPQTQSTQTTC